MGGEGKEWKNRKGNVERDLTTCSLTGKPWKEEKKLQKIFSVSEEGPEYGSNTWDLPGPAVQGSMLLKNILAPGCRESKGNKRPILLVQKFFFIEVQLTYNITLASDV